MKWKRKTENGSAAAGRCLATTAGTLGAGNAAENVVAADVVAVVVVVVAAVDFDAREVEEEFAAELVERRESLAIVR